MRINILKKTGNEMEFELEGEGHTFCNVLRKELLNDPNVEYAAYRIDHPLVGVPVFYVRTKGKDPIEALIDATNRIRKSTEEFMEKFKKAVSKYRK